ncbi:MAG TPA: hypothetical protein VE029_08325 [Rhizobacter sp.]|nr:hypothetical protein [Rhizobacter sp.]
MKDAKAAKTVKPAVPSLVVAGTPPVIFLDANVLLPQYLRSVFLDLAEAGLVHAHERELQAFPQCLAVLCVVQHLRLTGVETVAMYS